MPESIGERIKMLRTEKGMTLAELGENVSLSTSHLSQIERDKTAPSLATLLDIARALNVGPRYFFEIENNEAHIQRADRGKHGTMPDRPIEYVPLTPRVRSSKLEVYQVTLQPHTQPEKLDLFSGEEFGFVLSGELTISVGEEEIVLKAGDSVHYDAYQPHTWGNFSDRPCVIIWGRAASLEDH